MKTVRSAGNPKQQGCLEESAYLELLKTADLLSRKLSDLLKTQDLSATQYNVLRILRGASDGLPCGEIGNRMITRDPDITRLLDRLEKRGLISRHRETKDRRMVMAQITASGIQLLSQMDEPVRQAHHAQLGHIGRAKLKSLTELLKDARGSAG